MSEMRFRLREGSGCRFTFSDGFTVELPWQPVYMRELFGVVQLIGKPDLRCERSEAGDGWILTSSAPHYEHRLGSGKGGDGKEEA